MSISNKSDMHEESSAELYQGPTLSTREAILEAAERMICIHGLTRVTVKHIVAEAGVAETSLFELFSRKDDVVIAVILERMHRFHTTVPLGSDQSVEENLAALARSIVAFYEGLLPMLIVLLADASLRQRHRDAAWHREGGSQYMLDIVIRYLTEEQNRRRINALVPIRSTASMLCGACFHWAFVQQSTGRCIWPGMDLNSFISALAASLWRSVAPSTRAGTRAESAAVMPSFLDPAAEGRASRKRAIGSTVTRRRQTHQARKER